MPHTPLEVVVEASGMWPWLFDHAGHRNGRTRIAPYSLACSHLTANLARRPSLASWSHAIVFDPVYRLNAALEGRYSIEHQLGAGGMATVYRARDLVHEREVAVKVLKPELAAVVGADRFLTEIKTTAKLQHPHIVPLFDSGEAEGLLYYVMPYVAGESLRDRLERERELPVGEALSIARGVAEALGYAHRQGVIHRDIKPGNVLLQDGQPMVADFGIALAVTAAGGERLTSTGLSIGTPRYMSPEQAAADREVDGRADVYSLACIVYEMLAGEPPFAGSTPHAVLARKLTDTAPDLTGVRETVPAPVARAVRQALSRRPADRFETAEAFSDALATPGAVSSGSGDRAEPATGPSEQAARSPVGLLAIVLASMAAGAALTLLAGGAGDRLPAVRLAVEQGGVVPALGWSMSSILEISPDGSLLAYLAIDSVGRRLYLKPIDGAPRVVEGSEGAASPTFSSDGLHLAYFAGGEVRRVDVRGGETVVVGSVFGGLRGATWTEEDRLVFSRGYRGGLVTMPAGGGAIEELTSVPSTESDRFPHAVTGARRLLFQSNASPVGVWTLDQRTAERAYVTPGVRPKSMDELIFYVLDETLYGQRFDPRSGSVSGAPEPLLGGVSEDYAISETGTLVYAPARLPQETRLMVMGPGGAERPLVADPGHYGMPEISPDGERVAAVVDGQLVVYDWGSGALDELGPAATSSSPLWSRDGRAIVFRGTSGELRRFDLATREDRDLFTPPSGYGMPLPMSWTPEGELIFIMVGRNDDDLWVLRDGEPALVVGGPGWQTWGRVSPDGRRLAYVDGESLDEWRVHVAPYPGPGPSRAISGPGGSQPRWGPDGRRLYFFEGNDLLEVAIGEGGEPVPSDRRTVLSLNGPPRPIQPFDVHPDGEIFVVSVPVPAPPPELIVITGWLDRVRDRIR